MPILFQELTTYDPYNAYVSRFLDDRFRYDKLHDKLKELPNSFLDFLFDLKTADFIKERVAIPFGLNRNQAQEIGIFILQLIVSDIYLGNITSEIRSRLDIDDQKAKTIAGLIVAELFKPILEELKKMHIQKFAKNMPSRPQQQNDDRTVDLRNNL